MAGGDWQRLTWRVSRVTPAWSPRTERLLERAKDSNHPDDSLQPLFRYIDPESTFPVVYIPCSSSRLGLNLRDRGLDHQTHVWL